MASGIKNAARGELREARAALEPLLERHSSEMVLPRLLACSDSSFCCCSSKTLQGCCCWPLIQTCMEVF